MTKIKAGEQRFMMLESFDMDSMTRDEIISDVSIQHGDKIVLVEVVGVFEVKYPDEPALELIPVEEKAKKPRKPRKAAKK